MDEEYEDDGWGRHRPTGDDDVNTARKYAMKVKQNYKFFRIPFNRTSKRTNQWKTRKKLLPNVYRNFVRPIT